jgi:hypothetical protein
VTEILEVGEGGGRRPAEVAGRPVRSLGYLPGPEASALLARSLAGFVAYPPRFLPKSTIFAAYAAHAVLPVSAWHRSEADGALHRGEHYWRPEAGGAGIADAEAIAAAAHAWYAGHSLGRQAEVYRRLLLG